MDATTSKKPRKSRKGYYERHPGGVLTRRPHGGARDTKPRAVRVMHASGSKSLLQGRLDGRSLIGRRYKEDLLELKNHLNGAVSAPVAKLCDQAVRLGLLADLSWGEVTQAETLLKDGVPHPAIDVFLKASKNQRDVLTLLGLQRRARDVTLEDVLQGRMDREAPSPISPLKFFSHLLWLDKRPLLDTIEDYRQRIFTESLFTFRDDGSPQYSLVVTGRGKKNFKSCDLALACLWKFLCVPVPPQGSDCLIVASDEGQANDDLSLIKKLIRTNPILEREVVIQKKAVERADGRGSLVILPGKDVQGAHGKSYAF